MISTGESIIKLIQDYRLEDAGLHSAYITDEGTIRLLFDIPRNYNGWPMSREEEEEARHVGTLRWIELEPIRRS